MGIDWDQADRSIEQQSFQQRDQTRERVRKALAENAAARKVIEDLGEASLDRSRAVECTWIIERWLSWQLYRLEQPE